MASRWWDGNAAERFWLEATDRQDLGTDLRAPVADESGKDNWRYTLFREAKVGDLVFHYDKRRAAISAVSRVAGLAEDRPIVWAARGSYARERGATPTEVSGYRIPLADFTPVAEPVTLEHLRAARPQLQAIYDGLAKNGARYFPFELSARPIRLLQGYAFKLPAAFVEAFPPLTAVASPAPTMAEDEASLFQGLVSQIEAFAGSFAISDLQRRRSEIRGLKRIGKAIFGSRSRSDTWAFHSGGRDELQFNLGLDVFPDDTRALRAGVAFSLEPSRSLPDPSILEPKIALFNAWMREHPEAFSDMAMWHYHKGERSIDYLPGPIPQGLISSQSFIFLGDRQPLSKVDPGRALQTLDRLLPLWDWVERGAASSSQALELLTVKARPNVQEGLRLDAGRFIDGGRWIQATTRERTFDIFLRHAEIQRRLKDELLSEGCAEVVLEPPIGQRSVDAVARHGKELWFYEVKTASTDRACLREAIGQLLEYALWPGATRPDRLVVVGEQTLTPEGSEYLGRLNAAFPIPIGYRQLALD